MLLIVLFLSRDGGKCHYCPQALMEEKPNNPVKFELVFDLRYQDTDSRLAATPRSLLSAMQEAAILHSEQVERGISWLSERRLSWMLVQTRVEFTNFPPWRSRLEVTTWPSEMGRLLSRREFVLRNGLEPVARATTLWAFMDTARRRVTRVPSEVSGAFRVDCERALERRFRRPAACDPLERQENFPVQRWEIDFNEHVNNIRYLDWMLETIPTDTYRDFVLRELNIRFQKEVGPGMNVFAGIMELPGTDPEERRFAHEIRVSEPDQTIASAETTWVRPDKA